MSNKLKNRTIYIGGKVSGLEVNEYTEIFQLGKEFVSMLECQDLDNIQIITPIDLCQPDWTWERAMDVCIEQLKQSDILYLLPNWVDSQGARTEKYLAEALKIPVIYISSESFHRFKINTKKTVKTMKEAIDPNGTFMKRLNELMVKYPDTIGIKRLFVHQDGKIDMTLLFNGTEEEKKLLLIFCKGKFPTEDNCTICFKNPYFSENEDYTYKIEFYDILIGK